MRKGAEKTSNGWPGGEGRGGEGRGGDTDRRRWTHHKAAFPSE